MDWGASSGEDYDRAICLILPTRGREWVKCHQPSTQSEAVTLMEDYIATENPAPWA